MAPLARHLLARVGVNRVVRPGRAGLTGRRTVVARQADGGLQVRHAVDGDRAVLVVQDDRLGQPARPGPQVDARRVDERAVDPEPPGGVVIAADQDHPSARRPEPDERVLIVGDRVHRRDGPVVDVARDEHGVHALGCHRVDEVVEECRLRVSQIGPMERPPEVPVRGVQEPHGRDSSEPLRHSGLFLGNPGTRWGAHPFSPAIRATLCGSCEDRCEKCDS